MPRVGHFLEELSLKANWRERAIRLGMGLFSASGVHRLAEPFTRGMGAILMFHRVRPVSDDAFSPNGGLEITPEFLDATLAHMAARGHDILSLDAVLAALEQGETLRRPFVALTFDDGYRDLADYALAVLERHRAPFTTYIASGFAGGSARLWWMEMEEAVRRLDNVDVTVAGQRISRPSRTAPQKADAFAAVYWAVRSGDEGDLRRVVDSLCAAAGIDPTALTRDACLDWKALALLARHELVTIGAHSVTHPRLAKLDDGAARREIAESRDAIEQQLGIEVHHFCYPVGDRTSAGAREFALAKELGFRSAVTTRPGMLFAEHRAHLFALPRVSVNGRHQSLAALDVLLSGAPFALINRGRRVAA